MRLSIAYRRGLLLAGCWQSKTNSGGRVLLELVDEFVPVGVAENGGLVFDAQLVREFPHVVGHVRETVRVEHRSRRR